MTVIFTEERSMSETLRKLFDQCFPHLIEGIDWQVIHFQGKADLEKNYPRKMQGWSYLNPHFIILRDNDGSDCKTLKSRLQALGSSSGKPFTIRIVCQELESWFLGDLSAVEAAYPTSRATSSARVAKFRDPDKLTNASDELAKLTKVYGKISKATAIAPHLKPDRNLSHSFQIFFSKFIQLHQS